MKRKCSLLALVLVVSGTSLIAASDFSKFLHGVFEQHAGRQPSGTELNRQAKVLRTQGPLESYITLFASDDYFTSRAQRNYETYVENLYRTFLMLTVSSQYRDVLRSSATTADQCRIAADNLEQALQRLEESYCRMSGASQMSRQILSRISQLVSAARLAHQDIVNPGGGGNWPRGDQADLYRQVETLRGQLQSYTYGLQHYRSTPDYDRLYRDVQSLQVQIDALSLMVRQGQSDSRLKRTVGSALSGADAVSRDVERLDLTIQQGWWTIEHGLDRVAQAVGVSHTWSDVGQPVILGNPVWQQLGTQPRPTVGIPGRNRDVVYLADQLLAKIDDARQSLAPLTYCVFRPGQLVVHKLIGGGVRTFDTRGISVYKLQDDLFRHWGLGLGTGDLHVATTGAEGVALDLRNVTFIDHKLAIIEQLVAMSPDGPADTHQSI